jgi:hypothetical protein
MFLFMNTGGKFNKWRLLIFANYTKGRNARKSFISAFLPLFGIGIQAWVSPVPMGSTGSHATRS